MEVGVHIQYFNPFTCMSSASHDLDFGKRADPERSVRLGVIKVYIVCIQLPSHEYISFPCNLSEK